MTYERSPGDSGKDARMSAEQAERTDLTVDVFLALLAEQRGLYERLLAMGGTQRSLITSDEPERLLALLGDRQKLVDRMEILGRKMRPYQQAWPSFRARMAGADAERADRLVAEVNALLQQILEADKADAQLLAARKGAVANVVSKVQAGKRVRAAYADAAHGEQASQRGWTGE